MVEAVYFYIFSGLLLFSALLMVTSKKPLMVILFLGASFFNGSALMLMLGAEFLAVMQFIIYVSAISVFLASALTMLNISFAKINKENKFLSKIKALIVAAIVAGEFAFLHYKAPILFVDIEAEGEAVGTVASIGEALFVEYSYPLQLSALIILVAIIGSTVLVFREKGSS